MFLLLNGRVPYHHHATLDSGDVAEDREGLHLPTCRGAGVGSSFMFLGGRFSRGPCRVGGSDACIESHRIPNDSDTGIGFNRYLRCIFVSLVRWR